MVRKVLFIQSSHVWDAIAATHAELMSGLAQEGVEVHVVCASRPSPKGGKSVFERLSAIPRVIVKKLDFGPSFHGPSKSDPLDALVSLPRLPLGLIELFRYMRETRPEIVHIGPKPRDVYGLLFAKLLRIKTVFHIHFMYGNWIPDSVKWAMRNSDFILGISKFSVDSVIEKAKQPPNKVDFVYNTLDATRWDYTLDGSKVRNEFKIGPDTPLLGIVARLIEWKGHAQLLEAMPKILAEFPDTKLLIIGDEAPQAQGRVGYSLELKDKARSLGLENKAIFAGYRSDIQDLMAAFDIFVFPAWEEGFGMVLLEAMAMKKPVVASRSGGPIEVVNHGETGFLVEPNNASALADHILTLIRDKELRKRFGEAGRERTERIFSPKDAGRQLAAIYDRCLRG